MDVSICNFTAIPDGEVERVCAAINRQLAEHFTVHWGRGARLRVQGAGSRPQPFYSEAVLYLWDCVADVPGPLAADDPLDRGLPFGFVFIDLATQLDEPWSVTLSREALALCGDASVSMLRAGPHPGDPDRLVYHWYEMCDAVEAETYEVESVAVSNFVLPAYFAIEAPRNTRTAFLEHGPLRPFGIRPGGSCGILDPATERHEVYTLAGDELAATRLERKYAAFPPSRLSRARRSARQRALWWRTSGDLR